MISDQGAVHIETTNNGYYKLVIGFYYYKEINDIHELDDLSKFDVVTLNNINFYRVSNYHIMSKIIYSDSGITILNGPDTYGFPLSIDILQLYES
jgi:hypothetical protein